MDAIRKKMKSLKDETDGLYAIINRFEEATKESNRVADQADCDIRDFGKKVHGLEIEFDETLDKLNKALLAFEEKDKSHRNKSSQAYPETSSRAGSLMPVALNAESGILRLWNVRVRSSIILKSYW